MRPGGAFEVAVACELAILREELTLILEAEQVRAFGVPGQPGVEKRGLTAIAGDDA